MNNITEISITLARLQENLQEIESAKKQVSIIVEAYNKTSIDMFSYAQQLANLHSDIDVLMDSEKNSIYELNKSIELIRSKSDIVINSHRQSVEKVLTEINSSIDEIQENFTLECNNIIEAFKTRTDEAVEKNLKILEKGISKIDTSATELNKLADDIISIHNEINTAMNPINTVLEKVQVLTYTNESFLKNLIGDISVLSNELNKFANNQYLSNKECITTLNEIRKENNSLKEEFAKAKNSNNMMQVITIILLISIIILFFAR